MSVKAKVLAILLGFLLLTAGYSLFLLERALAPSFRELEQDAARRDLKRAERALEREIALLDRLTHDWSSWDDTYAFVQAPSDEYAQSNLPDQTFVSMRLNLMAFLDPRGRVVWMKAFDLERAAAASLPDIPAEGLPPGHPLLRPLAPGAPVTGLWSTSAGPLLVSARPILTSADQGPAMGTLVMGRALLPDTTALLAEQTGLDLALRDLAHVAPDAPEAALANDALRRPDRVLLREEDRDTLLAATVIRDIQDSPLVLLSARLPRDIAARGRQAVALAGWSLAAAGGLTLAALALLLHLLVVRPLRTLSGRVQDIAEGNAPSARTGIRTRDEIGALSGEFDALLDRLEKARLRLLESSYLAGMTELASTVLHNVRHTFTPVAGDVSSLNDALKALPLDEVRAALARLRTAPLDTDREALVSRLVDTVEDIAGFMAHCAQTLHQARQNMNRIGDILAGADQAPPDFEQAPPAELAAVALALLAPGERDALELSLDHTMNSSQDYGGRRSLTELALAACLRESARAYAASGPGRGEAALALERGEDALRLVLRDQAPGAPRERLQRILAAGPPPCPDAAPHPWSAEALAAAGVILSAAPGPRGGAAFTLALLRREE
ncbi:MAG: CHASE4 domain-containing protein [Thermodesulfobacteriota bacterium]